MFGQKGKSTGVKVKALLKEKSGDIKSISSAETLYSAARVMAELKIGVLIVNTQDKKFAGVISEREIVNAMGRYGGEAANVRINDVIVKQVTACNPDTDLDIVIQTMRDNYIRHVPVIEDGSVSGIISISDILRHLLE